MITINRSKPFDAESFLGRTGWHELVSEQDPRSLALVEMDLSQVRFVSELQENEKYTTLSERLRRIKEAGHIRLDSQVFHSILENSNVIPEAWDYRFADWNRFNVFDGVVLVSPDGVWHSPYISMQEKKWKWGMFSHGSGVHNAHPSVVL